MRTGIVHAVAAALLLAGFALGDVVHYKGGRKAEGKVVAEDADSVTLETKFGRIRIPRKDIEKVERGKTTLEQFRERFEALQKKPDVAALAELARWCQEKGLTAEWKDVLRSIVQADPENEAANTALGLVRHEGKWMTPDERARAEQARTEGEMRAKGLVPYQGRWVKPEEKGNLEKGLVLHEGKWLTADEVQRAKGYVSFNGTYVPKKDLHVHVLQDLVRKQGSLELHRAHGPHADVLSQDSPDFAQEVCEALNQAGRELADLLKVPDLFSLWPVTPRAWPKPLVILFESQEVHRKTARVLAEHGYLEKSSLARLESQDINYTNCMPTLVLLYPFRAHQGDRKAYAGEAVHAWLGVVLGLRLSPAGPPDWLSECLAVCYQLDHAGRVGGWARYYADFEELVPERFRRVLRAGVDAGTMPGFMSLWGSNLDQLKLDDVVQGASLIRFLASQDRTRLGKWITRLGALGPPWDAKDAGPRWIEAHKKALREVYDTTPEDLQARWLEFVRKKDFDVVSK